MALGNAGVSKNASTDVSLITYQMGKRATCNNALYIANVRMLREVSGGYGNALIRPLQGDLDSTTNPHTLHFVD